MKSHIVMTDEIERAAAMYAPMMMIFSDPDFAAAEKAAESLEEGGEASKAEIMKARLAAYSIAMKNHKSDMIELLAAYDGVSPEEYQITAPAVIMKFMQIQGEMKGVNFTRNAETENTDASSGSAMENTEGGAI